jgi:hypothetical protein
MHMFQRCTLLPAGTARARRCLIKTGTMTSNDLHELRHKYKAAYTAYMQSVQALSEASQAGVLPTPEVLKLEEQALNELVSARRALLDALFAHGNKSTR